MTSISSVTAITIVPTVTGQNLRTASNDAQSSSTATSPASVVLLGQDTSVSDAEVYNQRGVVSNFEPKYTWESEQQNKVSLALMGNIGSVSTSSRFQGLGTALIEQLTQSGGKSISQSVIRPLAPLGSPVGFTHSAETIQSLQDELHNKAKNSVTLTLQTASGATISLSLSAQWNGLGVKADITGGELSDDELAALGDLAESFQGAIDGLSARPPKLSLGKLAQLDPSLFSSVDLSAKVENELGQMQTLSFQADGKSKSVDMSSAVGNVKLTVNNNATILGNSQQQAAALKNYLEQFDAAQSRGNGDKDLMNLFKDAFTDLNGIARQSTVSTKTQVDLATPATTTPPPFRLNDLDHALLTGLADFKASIKQAEEYINPMRPGEVDKFEYQVSQSTVTKGENQSNRSVEQNQSSQLSAAYHKSLGGGTLALGRDNESQNYLYYQVQDTASSSTRLVYSKGERTEASATQYASQNTTVQKYVLGKLVEQISTPTESSETKDLLGVLESAIERDRAARQMGSSTLKDDLQAIHSKILLQTNPLNIRS